MRDGPLAGAIVLPQ